MRHQLIIELVSKPEGGYAIANKIALITRYREIHKCTLLQAKKDVDAIVGEFEFYSKEASPSAQVHYGILSKKIERFVEEPDGIETLAAIDQFIFDLEHKKKRKYYDEATFTKAGYNYPKKDI